MTVESRDVGNFHATDYIFAETIISLEYTTDAIVEKTEIYANFALLRLGTLLYHMDNVSQEFYASLPKGIDSGWSAKRAAINNLWLIYRRFITCGGWAQTEVFGKAHYNIHSSRGTMTCDADAIYLCEALFYYGVLPKRLAMQCLGFSKEEQKAVSLGRIHAFSEVKAQKHPR